MFSSKNIKTAIAIILLCAGMSFLWWKIYGTDMVDKARLSEIKTNLASLITAEEAFYQEYDKYSADFSAIGYSPEGQLRGEFYLEADKVPQEYKNRLSVEDLPYVGKDDYQVLIAYKGDSGSLSFFKFKFGGTLQEIKAKDQP
ncbi:hypothetical protein DOM22_09555 [Bdellovibrio sp. ZAP7]|uniref:hypothetical protein n=1 Tax=Bdellovibrio sp. ZAP7 TaxID=2231053 RepID=UPI001156FFCC|nr:hypothetical protein [Bdellovibrio sp. ZAP7]QDK45379.1 hypothetical protein DOM22_09555 [Bdellovibrio sp. ZAP7]